MAGADSMHRVSPVSVNERFRHTIRRQEYRVPYPKSLWHNNGYHKLTRWKIVIHGGVMGIRGYLFMWWHLTPTEQLLFLLLLKKQ